MPFPGLIGIWIALKCDLTKARSSKLRFIFCPFSFPTTTWTAEHATTAENNLHSTAWKGKKDFLVRIQGIMRNPKSRRIIVCIDVQGFRFEFSQLNAQTEIIVHKSCSNGAHRAVSRASRHRPRRIRVGNHHLQGPKPSERVQEFTQVRRLLQFSLKRNTEQTSRALHQCSRERTATKLYLDVFSDARYLLKHHKWS